jgi:hypothetical protein
MKEVTMDSEQRIMGQVRLAKVKVKEAEERRVEVMQVSVDGRSECSE